MSKENFLVPFLGKVLWRIINKIGFTGSRFFTNKKFTWFLICYLVIPKLIYNLSKYVQPHECSVNRTTRIFTESPWSFPIRKIKPLFVC